jgi:hypothetical protein
MLICLVDFSCGRYLATKTQVDSAFRLEQVTKITLISVIIFTSLNTLLGVVFIGISAPDNQAGVIIIALVLKVLWSGGLIALSFMIWRTS